MLRLKTLLQRTEKNRHLRKRLHPVISKITRSSLMMDERGLFMLYHGKSVDLKHHKEHKSKGPYLQLAKLYYNEDGNMSNPKCFVWCDCDDFKYRSEVALAIRGSSAVINSNGALPKITNPTAIPQVCKHVLSFLERCVQRGDSPTKKATNKEPKLAKNDRMLVDSLRKPKPKRPPNIKRMFPDFFGNVQGTRF